MKKGLISFLLLLLSLMIFGSTTCHGFFGLFQRDSKATFDDLHAAANYLGQDLLHLIQPVNTTIDRVEDDFVLLKGGRDVRIRPGDFFEVYSWEDERYLGLLRAESVRARETEASIVEERLTIKPGDIAEMKMGGRIAILGFFYEGIEEELSRSFQNAMTSFFLRETHFDVIERQQLEQHLEELKLSYKGIMEESSPEVGRILGTDLILMGSISMVEGTYVVSANINETATGRMIGTSSVQLTKETTVSSPTPEPRTPSTGFLSRFHLCGGALVSTLSLSEHFDYFEEMNSKINDIDTTYDQDTYEKELEYLDRPGLAWGGSLGLRFALTENVELGALYEYMYCREKGGYSVSEDGEVFLEESLDYRFHLRGIKAKIYRRMNSIGVFYGGMGYYQGKIGYEETYLDRRVDDSWLDKGSIQLENKLGFLFGFSLTPNFTPSLGANLGFHFRYLTMSFEDSDYLGDEVTMDSFSGAQFNLALTYRF